MPVKLPFFSRQFATLERRITILLRSEVESSFTAIDLPTSEPSTPQFSHTIASNNLPDITPTPDQVLYIFNLVIVGRAGSTASTISWRILRNGGSLSSGSFAVSANNFFKAQFQFTGVEAGDQVAAKLWSSATGSNHDFIGWQIHPTRISYSDIVNLPCYVSYGGSTRGLNFNTANRPTGIEDRGFYPVHLGANLPAQTADTAFDILIFRSETGIFRTNFGDVFLANTIDSHTSSSRALTLRRNVIPTNIYVKVFNNL